MSKVSVVIPVYNVEQFIERCIKSIQGQTLKDIEIIIVNDCTPDNSMEIVRELEKCDNRIKIFEHEKNLGLMRARQTGYKAASSDYITFCDSDDHMPENAIEILYNEAIKNDADIVSGNILYIKTDKTTINWQNELKYGNDRHSAMKSLLSHELGHNLCSKLFKTSLLQDHEYQTFDHFTNGEDGCLFYQVVLNVQLIIQIDRIVYYYMQNSASSSQVRLGEKAINNICLLNKIRHESASVFEDLNTLLHICITNILYSLYSQGYGYSTRLDNYILKYNLQRYKILSLKYFSTAELVKLWIKRYIQGPMYFFKTLSNKTVHPL